MEKITLKAAAALLLTASATANATLEPRLGGAAYYDTVKNLTWTTDANIHGRHSYFDHASWVSTLVIDGVDGWRLPGIYEMPSSLSGHGVYSSTPAPFVNVAPGWYVSKDPGYSGWGGDPHPDNYIQVYTFCCPILLDPIQSVSKDGSFYLWPVHTGDVAALPSPVPETSTYAMLLAGLGLIGFIARLHNSL